MKTPTRAQAQGAIASAISERDDEKDIDYLNAESFRVEIDGRRQFFGLQKSWSFAIMAWISVLIIFNAGLTLLAGAHALDFTHTPWFVTSVTVETFLQVVGLGYVAARYLFSHDQNPTKNHRSFRREEMAQ